MRQVPGGSCCSVTHRPCSGVQSAVGHGPLTSVPGSSIAALPSGMSLLRHGSSCGSSSLRSALALVWQQFGRHFPQEKGNRSFCMKSAQLNSCSLLQCRAPYTSPVSNFGVCRKGVSSSPGPLPQGQLEAVVTGI